MPIIFNAQSSKIVFANVVRFNYCCKADNSDNAYFKQSIFRRCLLFISSMCKSNCDMVPTNDFLHDFGDERLSLDEDRLIEQHSRSDDSKCLATGLDSGMATGFTLLCTVTMLTTTILPFLRPSLSYTSRSSSTCSNVSSSDPSRNPPSPLNAILCTR